MKCAEPRCPIQAQPGRNYCAMHEPDDDGDKTMVVAELVQAVQSGNEFSATARAKCVAPLCSREVTLGTNYCALHMPEKTRERP
jgi:hypothetical protein